MSLSESPRIQSTAPNKQGLSQTIIKRLGQTATAAALILNSAGCASTSTYRSETNSIQIAACVSNQGLYGPRKICSPDQNDLEDAAESCVSRPKYSKAPNGDSCFSCEILYNGEEAEADTLGDSSLRLFSEKHDGIEISKDQTITIPRNSRFGFWFQTKLCFPQNEDLQITGPFKLNTERKLTSRGLYDIDYAPSLATENSYNVEFDVNGRTFNFTLQLTD